MPVVSAKANLKRVRRVLGDASIRPGDKVPKLPPKKYEQIKNDLRPG